MRTLVDIPDSQVAELSRIAKREKVSRAARVRQAIADLLATKRHKEDDAIAAAFGLWSDMKEDSLAYQERLRNEW
ncbi:MAG: ribbon-helix-helix protein, CopG family [Caulobacteraceae bacterium]